MKDYFYVDSFLHNLEKDLPDPKQEKHAFHQLFDDYILGVYEARNSLDIPMYLARRVKNSIDQKDLSYINMYKSLLEAVLSELEMSFDSEYILFFLNEILAEYRPTNEEMLDILLNAELAVDLLLHYYTLPREVISDYLNSNISEVRTTVIEKLLYHNYNFSEMGQQIYDIYNEHNVSPDVLQDYGL